MQDKDEEEMEKSAGVKKVASNPTPSRAIGVEVAFQSNHLPDGSFRKDFDIKVNSEEKYPEDMRNRLMKIYEDIFTDGLREHDRINGDPIKLEVKIEGGTPYHCCCCAR